MKTAKDIKDQAATVKRTVTAIRKIIESNRLHKRINADNVILSDKEIEQLERSASILSNLRAKTAAAAIEALTQEEAKKRAIEKVSAEAAYILGEWPAACSVLDKTAFIIGNNGKYSLQSLLASIGINYDYAYELNCLFEEAIRNFPNRAAGHADYYGKPIIEVMAEAAIKLSQVKKMTDTQELATAWQNKIDQMK